MDADSPIESEVDYICTTEDQGLEFIEPTILSLNFPIESQLTLAHMLIRDIELLDEERQRNLESPNGELFERILNDLVEEFFEDSTNWMGRVVAVVRGLSEAESMKLHDFYTIAGYLPTILEILRRQYNSEEALQEDFFLSAFRAYDKIIPLGHALLANIFMDLSMRRIKTIYFADLATRLLEEIEDIKLDNGPIQLSFSDQSE